MSSSDNNNSSRKGKGRQKVEMMKIENESNLQVTFSKRRTGLFKKASELSTLCGAETALVVFSPGNKAHSFGHPNVDTITNRFLNQNVSPMSDGDKLLEAHQKAIINQQTLELNQLQKQLELEQKRSLELQRVRKEGRRQGWCPPNIDKLNYQQLDQLKGALLQFRHRLETKVQNATNFQHPYFPRSVVSPSPTSGNRERLVLGRPSPRVRFDDGVSGFNASIRINPKANNLGVGGFTDATTGRPVVITSYDPMAGDSSLTIPYSSTATTSTVDPSDQQ